MLGPKPWFRPIFGGQVHCAVQQSFNKKVRIWSSCVAGKNWHDMSQLSQKDLNLLAPVRKQYVIAYLSFKSDLKLQ